MSPPQPSSSPHSFRQARRRRRWLPPAGADERSALLAEAARRAVPSAWFFLQITLAALIWAWALVADLPAGLVLGALAAPFCGPVVGLGLGLLSGTWGYLGRMLGALTVGGGLAFLIGLLGGVAALVWPHHEITQALAALEPGWGQGILLGVGVVWAVWALVRAPQHTALPGVALAYTLWLPLTAAGFGLSNGQPVLGHRALLAFGLHLALAVALTLATAWALGLRPLRWGAFALGLSVVLLGLAGAGWLLRPARATSPIAPVSPPPSPQSAAQPSEATAPAPQATLPQPGPMATATSTPTSKPSATPTPTPSPTPSPEPTVPTPTPTPIVAIVYTEKANGVIIRKAPGFDQPSVGGALNGTKVIILEIGHEADGHLWAKVYVPSEDLTGWVVQNLLIIATPAPRW